MNRRLTPVIKKHGKWHVAYVREIPGVNTQGRTLAEARRNLKGAVALIIEANRELSIREQSENANRDRWRRRGDKT